MLATAVASHQGHVQASVVLLTCTQEPEAPESDFMKAFKVANFNIVAGEATADAGNGDDAVADSPAPDASPAPEAAGADKAQGKEFWEVRAS